MADRKKELPLLLLVAATAILVVTSSMAGAAAATPCFPLDCASFVLDARPVPLKFCCIEVQDQFLLKNGVGIQGYCKAVKAVKLYNGPLTGTELDLALSVPSNCSLSSYYSKGFECAGKSEGAASKEKSSLEAFSTQFGEIFNLTS